MNTRNDAAHTTTAEAATVEATHRMPSLSITGASPLGNQLRAALDGEFHDFKEHIRAVLEDSDVVRPYGQTLEEARAWTLEKLLETSMSGHGYIGMPDELDGEHTLAHSIAFFELLAASDLSLTVKYGVQFGLFGGALLNLGTPEQRKTWLPGALNLDTPGCYGMTERGRGSDVQNLRTTITYVPETDEFEVHTPDEDAEKCYIGNAARDGRIAVVFGQLIVNGEKHGVHCIVVPVRDEDGQSKPGVTLGDHGHKGGLLGVDNGTIRFTHVRVPRANLLARYGGVNDNGEYESVIDNQGQRFTTMLSTLVRGRISVGGAAASAARKALTVATLYARKRTQFNKTDGAPVRLIEYQAHQRKLMVELARAYAYGFAQTELNTVFQSVYDGEDEWTTRELQTRAAGMKAVQTDWANRVIQVCREACGGAGYITDSGLTSLRADADVFATFEGDNTVLRMLVSRGLLAEFRSDWKNLDMLEAARRSATLVGNRILERTTARSAIDRLIQVAQRKSGAEKMAARGWHVELMEYRERRIVESLGLRMREVLKMDKDKQFDGFNACQNHMIDAADAHMERIILEAFIGGIEKVEEGRARETLIKLCDLYALSTVEKHAAWHLEHDSFDGSRSRAISAAVEALCKELSENAIDIVDGLGVNESFLNSSLLK